MKKIDITALIAAAKTGTSGDVVTWDELSAILTQLNTDTNTLTYSGAIEFTQTYTDYGTVTVSGAMTITKTTTGAVAGTSSILRLVANGINAPILTAWKEMTGSSGYDNRAGITNTLVFFFDGANYWVNIFQEVGATPIDLVAPTLVSAVVSNANASRVVLTYSEPLDSSSVPAPSAFSISGKTISAVSVSGSVVNVDVSVAFISSDTIAISYTAPSSGKIHDLVGNNAANLTAQAVTNNIAAPSSFSNVPWALFTDTSIVASTYLKSSTSASSVGAVSSLLSFTADFEVLIKQESTTETVVISLDNNQDANYTWGDSAGAILVGAYRFGDGLYRAYLTSSNSNIGTYTTLPYWVKLKRSGDDVLIQYSSDNSVFTTIYTHVGILSGIASGYVKATFVGATPTKQIEVKYKL